MRVSILLALINPNESLYPPLFAGTFRGRDSVLEPGTIRWENPVSSTNTQKEGMQRICVHDCVSVYARMVCGVKTLPSMLFGKRVVGGFFLERTP